MFHQQLENKEEEKKKISVQQIDKNVIIQEPKPSENEKVLTREVIKMSLQLSWDSVRFLFFFSRHPHK